MKIYCKEELYSIAEKDGKYYAYNSLYEGSVGVAIIGTLLELPYPDKTSFKIPLCIEFEKEEDDVVIERNLEVKGTSHFRYFISKKQYNTWLKSAFLVLTSILVAMMIAMGILVFNLFSNGFRESYAFLIVVMGVLSLGIYFAGPFQLSKRKKYEIVDIIFEE